MIDGSAADKPSSGDPLGRVLALTPVGRQELRDPQSGLSLPQRWLLGHLDGESSLEELAAQPGSPAADRLPRDAAKLASLGLALDMGEPGPSASSFGPSTQYGDITLSLPLDGAIQPAPLSPAQAAAAPARRTALWLALVVLGGAGAVAAWVASGTADAPAGASLAAAPAVASARAAPAASPAIPALADAAAASAPAALASVAGVAPPPPAVPVPLPPAVATAAVTDRPPNAPVALPTPPAVLPNPPAAPAPAGRLAGTDPAGPRSGPPGPGAGQRPPATPPGGEAAVRAAVGTAPSAQPAVASPPPATTSIPAATVAAAAPVVSATPVAAAPVLAPPTLQPVPGTAPAPATVAPPPGLPPPSATPAAAALQAAAPSPPPAAAAVPLRPIALVEPTFPRDGQGIGARGVVLQARLVVAPNGTVSQVSFPQSSPAMRVFERAARSALLQWRFPEGSGERVVTQSLRFSEE